MSTSPCGRRSHAWGPWFMLRQSDIDFYASGYQRRTCDRCGKRQRSAWWRR